MELLQKASSVAMLAFVLSSMLAMGLNLTVGQIITPLRNVRLVTLSLLVNFVLMPLAATGLATLLRLDEPLGIGLLLFIAIGLVLGWFLGGPDINTRRVLALGTAQRNIAAALVVGSQSFSDPKVVVMVVVVAIVSLLVLMPLSRKLAKYKSGKAENPPMVQ